MDEKRDVVTGDMEPSDAATAFAKLTGEVVLLRRAVEQMSTERAEIDGPDYSITLGEMAQRLAAIEGKPAMMITPEDMAARIGKAAVDARNEDRARLAEARKEHDEAAQALQRLIGIASTIREQHRRLKWVAGGGLFAGMLLWSFLPGVILRSLPQSWHMPESMAAHIIGEHSIWEAGGRMMRVGDPESWRSTLIAVELWRDNRDALAKCERAAHNVKDGVRCTIRVKRP